MNVCSPSLFSSLINKLASKIIQNIKHAASLFIDYLELFILLFADDVVLIVKTVTGFAKSAKYFKYIFYLELVVN